MPVSTSFDTIWTPLDTALAVAAERGRVVEVWLRDDDAVTRTPQLAQLAGLSHRFGLPVLLAVIPAPAQEDLVCTVADVPLFTPTQHGFAHTNHARPGERACELGGDRPLAAVLDDLTQGRARLTALFGKRPADILVPPWNRIDPAVLPHLQAMGFAALSTFAEAHRGTEGLAVLNCDLDIIDWRQGRRCRPHDVLASRLAALIDRGGPVGLLTHHLVHDETAWTFLDAAFDRLARHPSVRLTSAEAVRAGALA